MFSKGVIQSRGSAKYLGRNRNPEYKHIRGFSGIQPKAFYIEPQKTGTRLVKTLHVIVWMQIGTSINIDSSLKCIKNRARVTYYFAGTYGTSMPHHSCSAESFASSAVGFLYPVMLN